MIQGNLTKFGCIKFVFWRSKGEPGNHKIQLNYLGYHENDLTLFNFAHFSVLSKVSNRDFEKARKILFGFRDFDKVLGSLEFSGKYRKNIIGS